LGIAWARSAPFIGSFNQGSICRPMNRRSVVLALGTAIVAPALTMAQTGRMAHRIGFVIPPREEGARSFVLAFREGLRSFGYVEGKNIEIDFRFAEDDPARLPALAEEIVKRNPSVIVTASPPGVRAVRDAAGAIPIVMAAVYDPVGQGFVASLGRPGGNITGVSVQYEDTVPKILELLKSIMPAIKKIWVLRTADPSHQVFLARISELAAPKPVVAIEVNAPKELGGSLSGIGKSPDEVLLVLPHPLFNTRPEVVTRAVAQRGVPAMYPFGSYADAGGFMSFGIELPEAFRRAAYYVARILGGAKPAELPVEQPTKITLTVNLKTASALRIKVPQSVLLRADRVIE
jgi:putative tryptophan/tyrosine transport system substrate-binding protein